MMSHQNTLAAVSLILATTASFGCRTNSPSKSQPPEPQPHASPIEDSPLTTQTALTASQRKPGYTLIVSWTEDLPKGTPAADVTYYIQGEPVGKGIEGFNRVVDEVEKLAPKHELSIVMTWPDATKAVHAGGGNLMETKNTPYANFTKAVDRLEALCKQHKVQWRIVTLPMDIVVKEWEDDSK
jgi:hypothetical protein